MKTFTKKQILSLLLIVAILTGYIPFGIFESKVHAATIEWTNSSSLPTSAGEYKLMTDVVISSEWRPAANTTLDLNGYGIRYSGGDGSSVILVSNGVTFTINDSNPAKINYITLDSDGRGVSISNTSSEGAIKIEGGYITGGSRPASKFNSQNGGGIRMEGGTLIMNGGTIVGNRAFLGAGVYLYRSGGEGTTYASFTMNGGTIKNNTSSNAAGVNLERGHMIMTGGNVIDNCGPGIRIVVKYNCDLSISGSPIISNNGSQDIGISNSDNPENDGSALKIIGNLTNTEPIVVGGKTGTIFTSGLAGYGDYTNFKSNNDNQIIVDADGEAKIVDAPNIVKTSSGWEGNYDGNAHSISVTVTHPDDYTIKYGTSSGTYNLNSAQTYTNVGTYTVYYQITAKENGIDAAPVYGSETVIIKEVDKTALNNAITNANNYYNSIKDAYPDIANTLNSAISTATGIKNNKNVTAAQVTTATNNMNSAVDTAKANVVISKINAIGTVNYPDSGTTIEEVRAAYNALTDTQKALVSNYSTFTRDENDFAEAKKVIEKIDDIDEYGFTAASKQEIDEARAAYNALTADQKEIVDRCGKTNVLTTAETNYANYSVAAKPVMDKIKLIGTVEYTAESKAKIDDARAAFNALNDEERLFVSNYYTLTKSEARYEKLKIDHEAAVAAEAKIDEIGTVEYTDACLAKINEARATYNALTDDQKALVNPDKLAALVVAETTYNNVKNADDKINEIGEVEYTNASKTKIDEARAAYNALTDNEKTLLGNEAKETLEAAEAEYAKLKADHEAAETVETKINAIGTVKYDDTSKEKIEEAREAYDALTDDQKALVSNSDTLFVAETTYQILKDDAEAIAFVEEKINAIGTVEYTDESKVKIEEARSAYAALPERLKDDVANYNTLTTAEGIYNTLKTNNEAAKAAEEKINAIGDVKNTEECKGKIEEAREAFDALTDDQKALVSDETKNVLKTAEETYPIIKDVEEKIDAIGEVEYTEESKVKIDEARDVYDTLKDTQKVAISNLDTLTKAENDYKTLKADHEAAEAVETKINEIGELELSAKTKVAINVARAAYDALTDEQKTLVSEDVKDALEKAEVDYQGLINNNKLRITYISTEKMINDKTEDLIIVSNGDLEKLVEILVNGETLDPKNYTLASGSTILTLKETYLASLDVGKYDVTFVYNDGRTVDSQFEIEKTKVEEKKSANPTTGDNITLWISLVLVSMVGIVGTKKITRKKRRASKH